MLTLHIARPEPKRRTFDLRTGLYHPCTRRHAQASLQRSRREYRETRADMYVARHGIWGRRLVAVISRTIWWRGAAARARLARAVAAAGRMAA